MHAKGLVVASIIVALGVLVPAGLPNAQAIVGCSNLTYSGTVYDQEATTLPGVAVKLVLEPVNSVRATPISDSNGHWSATFQVCFGQYVNAGFYWQSSSSGPLVLQVSGIATSSRYTLNIWRNLVYSVLVNQYPNSANIQISYTTTATFSVFVKASVTVGMNVGFLQADAQGNWGTTDTIETDWSVTGTQPYEAYYPTGIAYKVVDTQGRVLIYVGSFTSAIPSTMGVSEYMTMDGARQYDDANGIYPYEEVAPGVLSQVFTKKLTSQVSIDGQITISAFGSQLQIDEGVQAGTEQDVSLILSNPNTSYNACYVVYQNGLNIHSWFYGYEPIGNTCPVS